MRKQDEKIIQLYNDGCLLFYCVAITRNQIQSSTSPFYRKYKNQQYIDHIEVEQLPINDIPYKDFDILKYCNENRILSWYEKEMLSIYYKLGEYKNENKKVTFRSIQDDYNIHYASIYLTVTEALEKIKKHVKRNKTILHD